MYSIIHGWNPYTSGPYTDEDGCHFDSSLRLAMLLQNAFSKLCPEHGKCKKFLKLNSSETD